MDTAFELSEESVAARMLQGDREAFSLLYERYFPRVYDLAFRMLGDPDLALDVAQETFLKFLEGRPRRPPHHFRAYLYTIARHQIYDALRRSRRQIPLSELPPEGSWEPVVSPSPEPEILQREQEAILQEVFRALPEEERFLLDLHLRHGLSPAELARIFGRSTGAIHTRLSRARDHFEEAFTAWILTRIGRASCPTLAAMVGEPRAPVPALTPDLRRALRRHLEGCAICQETRRRYWSAAEWLGAVGIRNLSSEREERARERLSQRAQALTAGGMAAGATGGMLFLRAVKGFGIALSGSSLALGLGAMVLGFLLAVSGSAEVRVENRSCPPLTSPPVLSGLVSRLPHVEIPSVIPPGASGIAHLPPGAATLTRSGEGIRVEAYGLAFMVPIAGLEQAEWDGVDLPQGPYPVRWLRGSQHVLRVTCR